MSEHVCLHVLPVVWWWGQLHLRGWNWGTGQSTDVHLRCQAVCLRWGNPGLPSQHPSKTAWSSLRDNKHFSYAVVLKTLKIMYMEEYPLFMSSINSHNCSHDYFKYALIVILFVKMSFGHLNLSQVHLLTLLLTGFLTIFTTEHNIVVQLNLLATNLGLQWSSGIFGRVTSGLWEGR